ncbi:Oxysterol-binding protein [Penicillium expansum]|uniref:Oxysterol-binding protein n=1 Tax=Penicillium expansum TaxID=27334 RepID=A0A0A2JS52_PENEN|nr:Oxysterol-binding protein [Penicillium expansum]KGO37459.1 Oxysterol-binding protein [Penicillium expansum]KGO57498.1 Oxysterol-binding protein [Penicillium expansum]
MAAMEELEIHSKSYFVRWINVSANHTISWSIQPHKKSVNFGIFKHPGQSSSLSSHLPASDSQSTDSTENLPATATTAGARQQQSAVIEKLTGIGLKTIKWTGKCEADKITQGTYDVPFSEGGNYALVFDNTFSKQISKTLTLVLLTYPTGLQPHSSASITTRSQPGASTESLPQPKTRRRGNSRATLNSQHVDVSNLSVHTGLLQKRRRKRHQGWARRYFSLDFTSSTLSYYHDRNSSTLRGAIPLSLAAVATNEKSREISIDSGTEIWHLRASNEHEFGAWKSALEKASSKEASKDKQNAGLAAPPALRLYAPSQPDPAEENEWTRVESLVSHISGSRDVIRRLAKDTDPKYLASPLPTPVDRPRSRGRSPSPQRSTHETTPSEAEAKRSFWKRKASGASNANSKRPPAMTTNSSSSQLVVPPDGKGKPASVISHIDSMDEVHDHLMAVLRDLDNAVSEFSTLISESKERRHPPQPSMVPRRSMESDMSQEFFDARDGDGDRSPLLTIHDSDEEGPEEDRPASAVEEVEDDAPSDSDGESDAAATRQESSSASGLFPVKPKSLIPLPLDPIKRRANILAPTVLPPSLIGFLRKNVGKDLSTISMPVSANEPMSLLQRAAEVLEYSNLLDQATQSRDPVERLMYVTAFAISSLSSNRVRERSIRKPFNPMLGETYELVREDRGFRFIAEKVSHRPVQLAYQADSKEWSISQSPMPSQKFWGKSAEITTEGRVRITLHSTGDRYSWTPATSFLRNIIAGEKYVEPVGELAVTNETTGHRSISTFKAGGMFSGRSEEVSTRTVDANNNPVPLGLTGSWPTSLSLTRDGNPTGNTIWTAGSLVPSAPKHYGLTSFAAALNEITSIEDKHLPATDSRLRPDQRALENGDLDHAEEVKVQLEEGQRARRRDMENAGESWIPRWFTRVSDESDGEVAWRLKGGKDGYWEERAKGTWSNVVPVFED